jgi:hypothetical protein
MAIDGEKKRLRWKEMAIYPESKQISVMSSQSMCMSREQSPFQLSGGVVL